MTQNSGCSQHRVVRHDPGRERWGRLLRVLLLLLLVCFAFWYGSREANKRSHRFQLENTSLKGKVKTLEAENEILRQKAVILESSSTIDREAVNNVRVLIRKLEDEKEQLYKDLKFYKSVMAPEELKPGIRVAGLDLEPADKERSYRLKLVVAQVARLNPFVKGVLKVFITGKQGGKAQKLSLHKLAGLEEDSTALGFRYFQSLPDNRGFLDFQLPEGFEPESIDLNVRIHTGGVKNFKQSFEWKKELAADVQ